MLAALVGGGLGFELGVRIWVSVKVGVPGDIVV